MRGKFINVSQAIMRELDYCMSIFEAPIPESEKGDQDMEAWKAWRQELHNDPELKRDTKSLRRDVHRSITQRNKYVHGILGWNNNDQYLEYEKEGKMVQEPFDILIMEKEYQEMIDTVDKFRILNTILTRLKNQR